MFVKAKFTFWEFTAESDVEYIISELVDSSVGFIYQPPSGNRSHLLGVREGYENTLESVIPFDITGEKLEI